MENASDYIQFITLAEALKEYRENSEFRNCLETGRFLYAEGYFVFNDPQIVCHDSGKAVLTDYAHEHLANCTLSFEIKHTFVPEDDIFGSNDIFGKGKIEEHKHFDLPETKKRIESLDILPLEIRQEWLSEVRTFEYQYLYDQTCWKMIGAALKERHTNPEEFQEKTLLLERYYYRAQNDEHEQAPTMRTIMAIAAGYSFDLPFTRKLLELAGLALSPADPEHKAYEFILRVMPGYSIHEKNEFLKASGLEPLGSKERKQKDSK